MEPHSSDVQLLQRLIADYRRMSLVYGISIISLSLVITAMVWAAPSFNVFPETKTLPAELDTPRTGDTPLPMPHQAATTTGVYPE